MVQEPKNIKYFILHVPPTPSLLVKTLLLSRSAMVFHFPGIFPEF